jgi:hypothetical protein
MVALSTAAPAQQTTLNFDDLGSCSGSPLSTYGGWINLTSAANCQTGDYSWLLHPKSGANYLKTNGNIEWTFNSPVVFNGLWASGYGAYYLELLNGNTTVATTYFGSYGSLQHVGTTYAGQVDRVRIRSVGGAGYLGVDDISFTYNGPPPGVDIVNQPNAAPEPATLLLVASGLGGLGALARRRRKQKP